MVTKGRKENRDRTGSFSGVTKPDDIRSRNNNSLPH